jgi:hypothetical protein
MRFSEARVGTARRARVGSPGGGSYRWLIRWFTGVPPGPGMAARHGGKPRLYPLIGRPRDLANPVPVTAAALAMATVAALTDRSIAVPLATREGAENATATLRTRARRPSWIRPSARSARGSGGGPERRNAARRLLAPGGLQPSRADQEGNGTGLDDHGPGAEPPARTDPKGAPTAPRDRAALDAWLAESTCTRLSAVRVHLRAPVGLVFLAEVEGPATVGVAIDEQGAEAGRQGECARTSPCARTPGRPADSRGDEPPSPPPLR